MPLRHSQEFQTAKANLDAYTAQQRAAGDHEETDEYVALNDAVINAADNEKNARTARRSRG